MKHLTLAKPQFVTFAGNKLTDHNRQPTTMTVDQIENPQRMANGSMRKYFVASKRNYTFTWNNVPGSSNNTVDGFWGARDIEQFYFSNPQSFSLVLHYVSGDQTIQVFFSSFENDPQFRYGDDYYNLTIGLEEV